MDLRVQRTLQNLLEAFEQLLQTQKYEDITVSILCNRAMLRRTTFYKHFKDKDDFFKFYMSRKREELKETCGIATNALNVAAYQVYMLDTLMNFFIANEALVNNLFTSSQRSTLLDSFAQFMTEDIKVALKAQQQTKGNALDGVDCEYLSAAISGSTIQTLKQWWANGHKSKDRKKIVQVNALVFPGIKASH